MATRSLIDPPVCASITPEVLEALGLARVFLGPVETGGSLETPGWPAALGTGHHCCPHPTPLGSSPGPLNRRQSDAELSHDFSFKLFQLSTSVWRPLRG